MFLRLFDWFAGCEAVEGNKLRMSLAGEQLCLMLNETLRKNQSQAQEYCKKRGGHLAMPKTEDTLAATQEFLNGLLVAFL